jgi:hypothetical protein
MSFNNILIFVFFLIIKTILYAQTPHIVSTSPGQNELNVLPETNIAVVFDIEMNTTTISNSSFIVNTRSTGVQTGILSYNSGNRTVYFDPDSDFEAGEVVSVVITKQIQSIGGMTLESCYIWNFTVEVSDGTALFLMDSVYAVGNGPGSIIATDLNNDNRLDLVTTNAYSDNISVLLNKGDGTFLSSVTYAAGDWPIKIVSGDLDRDHDMDLVSVNSLSYDVTVFLNNGEGLFSPDSSYPVAEGPLGITIADMNSDGNLDLVVANSGAYVTSASISVLINTGDGTFASQLTYPTGLGAYAVYAADFDGDGDLDITTANSRADNISVHINNGYGTLTLSNTYTVPAFPVSVFASDFDGDGDLDISTANRDDDNISILLNDGSGLFVFQNSYAGGDGPRATFAGDVDNDGDQDLLVPNEFYNNIDIFLNDGSGNFSLSSGFNVGSGPMADFVADLDNDGDLDITTANWNDNQIAVFFNQDRLPEVISILPERNEINVPLNSAVSVTFNMEMDQASINDSTFLVYGKYHGWYPGSFNYNSQTKTAFFDPLGDFEVGDKITIILTSGVKNFKGNFLGKGFLSSFSAEVLSGTSIYAGHMSYTQGIDGPWNLAVGDIDSDQDNDLLVANVLNNRIAIMKNDGQGNFSIDTIQTGGTSPNAVCASDVDLDGDLDLIVTNTGSTDVTILENLGNGIFVLGTIYPIGDGNWNIFADDFNLDGYPDIAVSHGYWTQMGYLSILMNNGDGTFVSDSTYEINNGAEPLSVSGSDIDNDGDLDLATISRSDYGIYVYQNLGNGKFQLDTTYYVGSHPRQVLFADVNADYQMDLVIPTLHAGGTVAILMNLGNGIFGPVIHNSVNSIAFGAFTNDLDNDNDIDIISVNPATNDITVLLNDGTGIFEIKENYPVGKSPRAIVGADWDGDGDIDIATPNYDDNSISVLFNVLTPEIHSINPVKNELNVPTNSNINVTFSIDMDSIMINDTTFIVSSKFSGFHQGTVTYDRLSKTATFEPQSDFVVGELVTVLLTTEIQSIQGVPLDSIYCWQFTTAVQNGSARFKLDSSYSVGTNPYSPVSADFDNDGDLDLATANRNSNNISVLLNTGDANFLLSNNYEIGSQPETVFAADLDNDGDIDLAAANRITPGSVRILLNYGDGTFDVQPSFPSNGNEPGSIFAADLDGDSDLDLIIGNAESDNLSIFFNNGNATFVFNTNYSVGDVASAYAADLDNDGDLDLTGGLWANNAIFVLMNNGDGSFGSLSTYPVGVGPAFVKAADLNGDGYLDLCSTNHYDQTASVLMNNGNGTFATHATYNVGVAPYIAFPADLDSDGDLDLTVQNREDDNVSVLLNHGDGTFADQQLFSTGDGPVNILAADLDDDGDLDLATANINSNDVSILLNLNIPQITSVFPTPNNLNVPADASISVTFDLDMDPSSIDDSTFIVYARSTGIHQGQISYDSQTRTATFDPVNDFVAGEVVTAVLTTGILSVQGLGLENSQVWSFTIETGQGPAIFSSDSTYQVGSHPISVFGADLNSDGNPDLAIANEDSNSVSVLFNNGEGSLGPESNFPTGRVPKSVYAADFDNDGDMDLATANAVSANISLLYNNGSGNFIVDSIDVSGLQPNWIFGADFNGDGFSDLATANTGSHNISVFLNDGNGTFLADSVYEVINDPWSVFAADFDNDGDFDITTASYQANSIRVLFNNGDGIFVLDSIYGVYGCQSVIAADLNGDSYVDLATVNNDLDRVSVLLNAGNGTFGVQSLYPVGGFPVDISSADFDGDGDLDLATSNLGSQDISVLLNNGDATFAAQLQYPVNDPYGVYSADFDTDGDLDIAVTNWSTNAVTLLMNREVVGLETSKDLIPKQFALHQNYPNPFNPVTFINYDLPKKERVEIIIYNALGEIVKTLVSKDQVPGYHTAVWDATNNFGSKVSSGLYFYRLQAGEFISTKKLLLLK